MPADLLWLAATTGTQCGRDVCGRVAFAEDSSSGGGGIRTPQQPRALVVGGESTAVHRPLSQQQLELLVPGAYDVRVHRARGVDYLAPHLALYLPVYHVK